MGSGPSLESTLGRIRELMLSSLSTGVLQGNTVQEVREECDKMFKHYDADNSGALERGEMNKLANDLTAIHMKFVKKVGGSAAVSSNSGSDIGVALVEMWDKDKSNSLTFAEFSSSLIRVVKEDLKN